MADGRVQVPLVSLNGSPKSRVKVSSVLNRDIKQYGKVFMFDGEEETCWNSDRGSPQTVTVELPSAASVCCLEIRFQGGFATREGVLLAGSDVGNLKEIQRFYPADDNTLQSFPVGSSGVNRYYRLVFNDSTDFYGRTVVYHLQLCGTFSQEST